MKDYYKIKRLWLLVMFIFTGSVLMAQINIKGKVTDEAKEAIIGANVMVKGTTTGTITDVDGNFSISVPNSSSVLVISYIGFAQKEIPIGKKREILVELKEDGVLLDEVVAIGYATVKKSDLTGAVSSVDMEDISKAQVLSFDQALGGRIAGVQVVSNDGQPGAESNIVIRGSNTFSQSSDGNPLYVIDGFPTEDANLSSINPNDIESIDVLKDASATAIYGARGANGVIIVNTKRGKESAPRVTYDGYISWQMKPEFLDVMNGYDFVAYQEELWGDLSNTYYSYDPNLGRRRTLEDYKMIPYTNWQNEVFRAAPMTNHNIGLSGGSKNTKYSASVAYYNQQGIIIKSSYESIKARGTLDQQISKDVKTGFTFSYANNKSIGSAPSQGGGGSTQYYLYQVLAYLPVKYADDEQMESDNILNDPNYPFNPFLNISNAYSQNSINQLNINTYLNWNITKHLMFRMTFAYNWRVDRGESYNGANTSSGNPVYSSKKSNGKFSIRDQKGWNNEYTLTYRNKWNNHNLTALLGGGMNRNNIVNLGGGAYNVPWDVLGFWAIPSGDPDRVTATNFDNRIASYFTRINYDWRSRYLFTMTMRADGSSRFPYHKWGYFPSGSFAWRISEENFMKPFKGWLSNLKLRVGWGATGNCNTYKYYPSLELYNIDQNYAFNNSLDNPAVYYAQIANKNMKWETTYQTNIGLDFGFFNNRINGVVEIYDKQTKDLLLDAEVPLSTGFDKVQQNIGSIRNRGLEISVNTINLKGGKNSLEWSTNFNISFNKNEITALSGDQNFFICNLQYPNVKNLYIARVGHPMSEMYGYVYDGVYQYEDFNEVAPNVFVLKEEIPNNTKDRSLVQPGDMKLKDINGDGKVTTEDQTVIGHGLPIHTGGLTNNFSYKGFDLSVFFQWSYGNDVINYNKYMLENVTTKNVNRLNSVKNHWTPRIDNGDGTFTEGNYTNYLPRVNGDISDINTSRVIEDASFLRLKNVQIGYNFPGKLIRRLGLSSLRVYLSGQNLITWTKYSGYDPEVSTRNSALTRGFDYSSYPKTTSYTFGVKLGL